jgi:hypothetical protein
MRISALYASITRKFWAVNRYGLLLALSLSGCAVSVEKPVRFHYLPPAVLQSDMQQMADQLGAMATTIVDTQLTNMERRTRVLPMLARIESIAQGIEQGEVITNYSVVDRYMGAFLYDVNVAQEFVLRTPPNLVPAGRLIKSCMSCHDSL